MGALAVFGIDNDGLNLAVNLLILFLVVIWLALIYWTYADARRRIADPMLVGCATAASLFPFVGTIVYMIVRPPEYLEDVRERELEIAGRRGAARRRERHACPYCGFEVENDFLRCPSCLRKLKEPCSDCGKPLDPRWKICPYCEAEVGQAAEPRPRRARRPQGDPRRRAPPRGRRRRGRPRAEAPPRLAASAHATGSADLRGARMDRTLILVKPDAFARGLTGEIIARFERKGLRIAAMKHMTVTGSWPSGTTPSTARSRSSASWSSSSPAARWWPWCSRATRRSRPPAR